MARYTQEDLDRICNSDDLEFLQNFGSEGKPKVLDYTKLAEGRKIVPTSRCSVSVPDVLETGRIITEVEYDGETYRCEGDLTKQHSDFVEIDSEGGTVQFLDASCLKTSTAKVYDSKFRLEGNSILIFNQETQRLEKYALSEGLELSSSDKLESLTTYNGFAIGAEVDSASSKIKKLSLAALTYLLGAALLFLIVLIFKLKPFSLILMALIAYGVVKLHKKIWER